MFAIDRLKGWLIWQVHHHIEEVTLPLFDRVFPRLDELSGQIDEVRRATAEVQRIVTDDLDASNETAALLGRALSGLSGQVEQLHADVNGRAGAPPASDR